MLFGSSGGGLCAVCGCVAASKVEAEARERRIARNGFITWNNSSVDLIAA
jgi:hypothetical protein